MTLPGPFLPLAPLASPCCCPEKECFVQPPSQPGAKIDTTDLLQATKAGSVLHGWQEQARAGPTLSLNFYGSALAHEQVKVIDVEAIAESKD